MSDLCKRVILLDKLYLAADAATDARIKAPPVRYRALRRKELRLWKRYRDLVKEYKPCPPA